MIGNPIEKAIPEHHVPTYDAAGRPAYPGLLLFKMLLTGIWHGGLSDESVEDMANANLLVMRFLGLSLEDDVPDHSVPSRFRTRLTQAHAWNIYKPCLNFRGHFLPLHSQNFYNNIKDNYSSIRNRYKGC